MLSSIAYNLFALMRMVLPNSLSTAHAPTVRLRLYDVAALIVRHAPRCIRTHMFADHPQGASRIRAGVWALSISIAGGEMRS